MNTWIVELDLACTVCSISSQACHSISLLHCSRPVSEGMPINKTLTASSAHHAVLHQQLWLDLRCLVINGHCRKCSAPICLTLYASLLTACTPGLKKQFYILPKMLSFCLDLKRKQRLFLHRYITWFFFTQRIRVFTARYELSSTIIIINLNLWLVNIVGKCLQYDKYIISYATGSAAFKVQRNFLLPEIHCSHKK